MSDLSRASNSLLLGFSSKVKQAMLTQKPRRCAEPAPPHLRLSLLHAPQPVSLPITSRDARFPVPRCRHLHRLRFHPRFPPAEADLWCKPWLLVGLRISYSASVGNHLDAGCWSNLGCSQRVRNRLTSLIFDATNQSSHQNGLQWAVKIAPTVKIASVPNCASTPITLNVQQFTVRANQQRPHQGEPGHC